MAGKNSNENQALKTAQKRELSRKLDSAGWGLFFIWVGLTFLTDMGWGAGLLGVGIIILAEQGARVYYYLKLEGFWVVVGLLFFLGGIWELFVMEWDLVPILFIVAGIALLLSIISGKHKE